MKSKFLIVLLIIVTQLSFGQTQPPEQKGPPPEYNVLIKKAENLYSAKNYRESALTYSQAFKSFGWMGYENHRYDAGCSWALAGYADSAFFQLNRIIFKGYYANYNHIIVDPDLNSLHNDKRWQPLLDKVKANLMEYEKKYSGDTINFISINDIRNNGVKVPDKNTEDHKDGEVRIDRMWKVMPGKSDNKLDTANVYEIYFYKIYKEIANNPNKSYLQSYFVGCRSDEDYDNARYTWRRDTVVSVTMFNSKTNKGRNIKLTLHGQQAAIIEDATLLNMEELQKYLEDTKTMVKDEKYKEANERYIWFYNHALENDNDMRGVRNSFMLGYWMDLARVYPPAMQSIKEMRDRKTKLIHDNAATSSLFNDAESLNHTLKEDAKSIELFEFLNQKYPNIAAQSFWSIKKPLFEAKRYDILRNYIKNPMGEYNMLYDEYDMLHEEFRDTAKSKSNEFTAALSIAMDKNRFVVETTQLISFCIGINNTEAAKEIQQKALSVVDDKRLYDVIPTEKK